MAAITINQLAKTYDNGFQAVKGIDLPIRDQEFMVLVGPSGCGKTTTLRMIAGLEDITGGEIRIGERRVNEVEPKDRDIAMVFQNYALYPHMTVGENMAYALRLRKVKAAEIATKVNEAARMLNLTSQLDKLPKALSGGQRQRVALGRAIVRQPKAFLFDEPLSNLDAKLRGEMRFELKTLQARLQTTMVYVTHDQIEAMTLGDRITVMSQGKIQQVAAPTVVYDHPFNRFVAAFIGTPTMNFLTGVVTKDGNGFTFAGASDGTGPAPVLPLHLPHTHRLGSVVGKTTAIGIRPEHLSPADADAPGTIRAQVSLVEQMGDHQCVYLRLPGSDGPVVMRTTSRHRINVGQLIPVAVDTSAVHIFADTSDHAENLTLPPDFAQQQG